MTGRTFTLRILRLAAAVVVAALMASPPGAPWRLEAASRQGAAAAAAPSPTKDYVFPSGAGILFFYVKPDKSADFEAVVARLSEALDKTQDPVRKQQAASWRILKSVELQTDSPVYVFVFDPAVVGADYDPVKVLSEAAPAELQALYAKLKDATIRVERMALVKLR
jgi:hypothetical protein